MSSVIDQNYTAQAALVFGFVYGQAPSGGGRWVTVGTRGEIIPSSDGITWTPRFSPTANDLNGVAYGKGLFVAVGDNLPPNGTLLTSPDGLTWTRRPQFI